MISDQERECEVCCNVYPYTNFYCLADCSHQFCQQCCVSHVQAKVQAFSIVKCINAKCGRELKKTSQIYKRLPESVIMKLQKQQTTMKIQKDKNLRACMKQDCIGSITVKKKQPKNLITSNANLLNPEDQIKCSHCLTEHCPICFEISHIGPCNNNKKKQDEMMRNLKYRRCPHCDIWVEKKGGCQYLKCKCGCEFCYRCAVEFDKDPCRKYSNGRFYDDQIRNKISLVKLKKPQTTPEKLLMPFKLLFILLMIILLTIFSGLGLIIGFLGIFLPLLFLIAPGFFIFVYSELQMSNCLVIFARIATVILYPIVGAILVFLALSLVITYPFMRFIYPTRIYDTIDQKVTFLGNIYLSAFICLLSL